MGIEELTLDQELEEKIENAQNLEDVVAILREKGVEITEAQLKAVLAAEEGELDEATLEAVAGGKVNWKGVLKFICDTIRNGLPRPVGPRPKAW